MQIDEAIGIWISIKDYIPVKDRQPAAEQFVTVLIDSDMSDEDLRALADVDHWLDMAIKENLGDFTADDTVDGEDEWDDR